jgi:SAM-dependent methyltransferase
MLLGVLDRNVAGGKILDVGFGVGDDASEMRSHGAIVYGVEPHKASYEQAINQGNIDADKAYNCKIQDLPEEHRGTFDVVTLLKYNIYNSERDMVMQALNKAVAPNGSVIIGAYDLNYVKNTDTNAIEPLAKKYFSNVTTRYNPAGHNTYIYNLSGPREHPLPDLPYCAESFANTPSFQEQEHSLSRQDVSSFRASRPPTEWSR